MPGPRGRRYREHRGEAALYADVQPEVKRRLDQIAAVLGLSRGAMLDELVMRMPVDAAGLPPWLQDSAEQLPLDQLDQDQLAS